MTVPFARACGLSVFLRRRMRRMISAAASNRRPSSASGLARIQGTLAAVVNSPLRLGRQAWPDSRRSHGAPSVYSEIAQIAWSFPGLGPRHSCVR